MMHADLEHPNWSEHSTYAWFQQGFNEQTFAEQSLKYWACVVMYVTNVCNLWCGHMLFATNWMHIMQHLHPLLQVMFDFCRSMKHSISVDFSIDWGTYAMPYLICDGNWILKEDFL